MAHDVFILFENNAKKQPEKSRLIGIIAAAVCFAAIIGTVIVAAIGCNAGPPSGGLPESVSSEPMTEADRALDKLYDFEWTEQGFEIVKYTGSQKDVVFPSEYNGHPVAVIGKKVFKGCSTVESAAIPSSVKSVRGYAFSYCDTLKRIYITDTAAWCSIDFLQPTSNPLGPSVELYLNNEPVQNIIIPDGITVIGNYAFQGCSSLESITLPDSVSEIGFHAFSHCESLKSIIIPDSVTSIGSNAFYGCSSLKNVNLPNSLIELGDNAFLFCTQLESIIIPDGITSLSGTFDYCSALTDVTIPDGVSVIGERTFSNCQSLANITIPDSVTSIGSYAFADCTSLDSITLPENIEQIDNNAFFDTSITVTASLDPWCYGYTPDSDVEWIIEE